MLDGISEVQWLELEDDDWSDDYPCNGDCDNCDDCDDDDEYPYDDDYDYWFDRGVE